MAREAQFDTLKAIAILLVILQHCTTMLFKEAPQAVAALWAGVPLFVMASGAFQIAATKYTALQYYKKRFSRILPAFIFWSVIAYAISAVTGKYPEIDSPRQAALQYVPYLLSGKINTAFWFVYMIAGLFLITPLLQKFFNREGCKITEVCLTIWLLLTVLEDCGLRTLSHIPVIGLWIGYYIFGFWVRKKMPERSWTGKAALFCFGIALTLNVLAKSRGLNLSTLDAIEAASLFTAIAKRGGGKECRAASSVSRWTYAIYLSHFMLIGLVYATVPQISAFGAFAPIATLIVVAAAETAMCLTAERLRFFPLNLIGIDRQRQLPRNDEGQS